jgi:hypothetical protein
MLVTTAEDSYNIFRPNLEPDEDEEDPLPSEAASTTDQEESKTHHTSVAKPTRDYYVDSEEEDEVEQARMAKLAKKMNRKIKQAEDGEGDSAADGKRRKKQ